MVTTPWLHVWLHSVSSARLPKIGDLSSLGVSSVGAGRLELPTPCL
jgi:hypothetical protein